MSEAVIRLGDSHSHGGAVIGSASSVFAEGIAVARRTDPVTCPIHGPNEIAEGSESVFAEGLAVARAGDKTACGGTLIASQSTVLSG